MWYNSAACLAVFCHLKVVMVMYTAPLSSLAKHFLHNRVIADVIKVRLPRLLASLTACHHIRAFKMSTTSC